MYFYFRLILNINSSRVEKNPQMIQRVNKQIHKLIFVKKNSIKKEKTKNIRFVWKKSENIVMSSLKKKLWQRTK